ncbi:Membrane proteinTapt1/CMV receptor [Macrophomina phaseolina MS6]|uniref:Membrane proteinTapt1/CMV receptor n=1 Tax=Macrophomina phaseolina (strain MS6) TaxID=1126212 RepID=K2QSG4_MACPH|nr:Membrane proteinTapt1/CMV receptor [Macrophomina phaseolina MS6]
MTGLQDPESASETFPPLEPENPQLPTPALSPSPADLSAAEDPAPPGLGISTSPEGPASSGTAHAVEKKHDVNGVEKRGGTHRYGSVSLDGASDSRLTASDGKPEHKRRKSSVTSPSSPRRDSERERILKLSPAQIQELTSSPTSLPLRPVDALVDPTPKLDEAPVIFEKNHPAPPNRETKSPDHFISPSENGEHRRRSSSRAKDVSAHVESSHAKSSSRESRSKPSMSRTVSTPVMRRKQSNRGATPSLDQIQPKSRPTPLNLDDKRGEPNGGLKPSAIQETPMPSPMPATIPLPPLSIPTYLQLELSSEKPSPLYIHRSVNSDFPYESSRIKFERLLNFLILPFELEQSLGFGALACLDAWLYTFTILPLRFLKAIWILVKWWATNAWKEANDIAKFIYQGLGRLWQRRRGAVEHATGNGSVEHDATPRKSSFSQTSDPPSGISSGNSIPVIMEPQPSRRLPRSSIYRHRRMKSVPSTLMPNHKADILKGLLVISTCLVLMRFDASKTYHNIRGQAAIKLYVIYNVLEVCDRLFSALGQDILECLLSRETLDRNADGRSKVIRPFWMFLLALAYTSIHSTALFYQVITLNVAVNSYSNALLTLLMSNQFVEIKGTVFKKFEKENLFQLTCADMVERFQLWLMLMIIACRNIVEVGGLSILGDLSSSSSSGGLGGNGTSAPFRSTSIIPKSFTIFPKWTGQVLGPFLLVLGSEMLVDWLKHAYITKFNNTKPAVYGRFLDVLAKDYYSNAFFDQNLTKRLGLPVLPLACLFIRATIQTYHMFLATHMPMPIPSTATSLSVESGSQATSSSPATTAALQHIDHIFRRALGRSSFGAGAQPTSGWHLWSLDDVIAFTTMIVVFLVAYFVLLAFKLVLGMCLLGFARSRYKGMKEREKMVTTTDGKRVGGWGVVEVEDDKKRWIYADDAEGLRALRDRESKAREKEKGEGKDAGKLEGTSRYSMVAKRIW